MLAEIRRVSKVTLSSLYLQESFFAHLAASELAWTRSSCSRAQLHCPQDIPPK